jgi:hypothetical protein
MNDSWSHRPPAVFALTLKLAAASFNVTFCSSTPPCNLFSTVNLQSGISGGSPFDLLSPDVFANSASQSLIEWTTYQDFTSRQQVDLPPAEAYNLQGSLNLLI